MPKAIGFTGTQRGMTIPQMRKVEQILEHARGKGYGLFHHGDCVGADAQAHDLAVIHGYAIVIHPPTNSSKRAFKHRDSRMPVAVEPKKDYLARNHDIVDDSDFMIATPGEEKEQLRSGTWATIRYARKRGPVTIIGPNGTILN